MGRHGLLMFDALRLGEAACAGGKFHGVLILVQQRPRPLAPGLSSSSVREGSGSGSSPAEQFHGSVWCSLILPRRAHRGAAGWPPPPALRSGGGTPAARKPGSAGSRPSSPRPPEDTRLAAWAAPARPERHCRERRGPPAGDGLGNRGAIRAGLRCRDREHGGTQAVSRRSGSPREARSEGPKVLPFFLGNAQISFRLPPNLFPSPDRPRDACAQADSTPLNEEACRRHN